MASKDALARLGEALNDAIGDQARTYMARVTGVGNKAKGRIEAYSEVHGNIQVLCRTTDKLNPGDAIMGVIIFTCRIVSIVYGGVAAADIIVSSSPVLYTTSREASAALSNPKLLHFVFSPQSGIYMA
jgi:hypothetical protein